MRNDHELCKLLKRWWALYDSNSLGNLVSKIEPTAGTLKQWKTAATLMLYHAIPCRGKSNLYGLRRSQSSNFRVADQPPTVLVCKHRVSAHAVPWPKLGPVTL
jgi:hypothetical protein